MVYNEASLIKKRRADSARQDQEEPLNPEVKWVHKSLAKAQAL